MEFPEKKKWYSFDPLNLNSVGTILYLNLAILVPAEPYDDDNNNVNND